MPWPCVLLFCWCMGVAVSLRAPAPCVRAREWRSAVLLCFCVLLLCLVRFFMFVRYYWLTSLSGDMLSWFGSAAREGVVEIEMYLCCGLWGPSVVLYRLYIYLLKYYNNTPLASSLVAQSAPSPSTSIVITLTYQKLYHYHGYIPSLIMI